MPKTNYKFPILKTYSAAELKPSSEVCMEQNFLLQIGPSEKYSNFLLIFVVFFTKW